MDASGFVARGLGAAAEQDDSVGLRESFDLHTGVGTFERTEQPAGE